MFKLGTLKIPHRKHTAHLKAVVMPAPATVTLPVVQNIGAPATPVVKVGDKVCVGTKIAEANGNVSVPVHSSVSGTVKKIGNYLMSNGRSCQTITIESDGEMTLEPSITPPTVNNVNEFCQAIRESGIVGLGGAGFPTATKIESSIGKIDKIVINAAECEPYITSDNRTMIDLTDKVVRGIEILEKYFTTVKKIVIGIEKNKPEAIKKLTEAFKYNEKVDIEVLPATYPQGAEKVLIYNATGRIVPEGKLPMDAACAVFNISTVAFIAGYLETGIPLVSKTITVDGSAMKRLGNVTAPIGTSIRDVLSFVGADFDDMGKVTYGGPMMGVAVYNLDDPVLKTTNAITALNKADSLPKKQYPCLNCGKCVEHCPMGLNPTSFAKAMKIDNKDDRAKVLMDASVLNCMDCGCCSYVCPSHRPLVENNRLAKADLRKYQSENR